MPPKRKPKATPARRLKAGDIVTPRGARTRTEVVRNVFLVIQLANGVDERYEADERVEVHPPEEIEEDE